MADLTNLFNFLSLFGGKSASENLQNMDKEAGIGNSDGTLIKAEFSRAVNNNWNYIQANGWNGEATKIEDLIDKWWKSIDVDRSNRRIAGTSMNEVNALGQNELNIIDSKSEGFDWINARNNTVDPGAGGGTSTVVTPESDNFDFTAAYSEATNHYKENNYSVIKKLLGDNQELFNKITGSNDNKKILNSIINISVSRVLTDYSKIDYTKMDKLILDEINNREFSEAENNTEVKDTTGDETDILSLINTAKGLIQQIKSSGNRTLMSACTQKYGTLMTNVEKLTVNKLNTLIKGLQEMLAKYNAQTNDGDGNEENPVIPDDDDDKRKLIVPDDNSVVEDPDIQENNYNVTLKQNYTMFAGKKSGNNKVDIKDSDGNTITDGVEFNFAGFDSNLVLSKNSNNSFTIDAKNASAGDYSGKIIIKVNGVIIKTQIIQIKVEELNRRELIQDDMEPSRENEVR